MSVHDHFLYQGDRTTEISFPLGGIGTGSIGLSGAGRLIDWEIFNRPSKGSTNGFSHFAIRAERDGQVLDARILNGPYRGSRVGDFTAQAFRNYGFGARRDSLAGVPHFETCRFDGRFPVARLDFADPHFPGTVEMTGFNPFVPMSEDDSSMPVAMFEFRIRNTDDAPVDYTLAGVLGNPLPLPHYAEACASEALNGVTLRCKDRNADASEYAELFIGTDAPETSRQTYLFRGLHFDSLDVYWKDLNTPGRFRERLNPPRQSQAGMRDRDYSLQAAHVTVAPGDEATLRFLVAWYAPQFQKYWITQSWLLDPPKDLPSGWKNWYATRWSDVEAVAGHAFAHWDRLRAATTRFQERLYATTIPLPVLDAAAANLSTLKSPTTVRLTDGTFYGWEGAHQSAGSCEGSCTHVWNYQQALPALFPALERSMRDADYTYNMDADGGMRFRLQLPLGSGIWDFPPCVDGQFGNVMKFYRDWKSSADDDWLRRHWPKIRRSIAFAWSPNNAERWDPDRTGVIWGRQHHTLDMELFGPSSWLTGFYLGALKAGAEMAAHLGETDDARLFEDVYRKGRRWVDENLFNGEYFVQKLDLNDPEVLRPFASDRSARFLEGGGARELFWSEELGEIKYQLGDGCLIDQVLPQWHANHYGLGELFERDKVVSALEAIFKYNFKPALGAIFNPCRVYGVYDEAGTVICEWPEGARRPAVPIPYAQETMHGMEYAFGDMLMQYGLLEEGVRVFKAVRDRYDGRWRNPWSEIECGSNYARSMASWAALHTLSGFRYDAAAGTLRLAPIMQRNGRFESFWAAGGGWGSFVIEPGRLVVTLDHGRLTLRRLELGAPVEAVAEARHGGRPIDVAADADGALVLPGIALGAGDVLELALPGVGVDHLPEVGHLA